MEIVELENTITEMKNLLGSLTAHWKWQKKESVNPEAWKNIDYEKSFNPMYI